jgi:hypothetical protein
MVREFRGDSKIFPKFSVRRQAAVLFCEFFSHLPFFMDQNALEATLIYGCGAAKSEATVNMVICMLPNVTRQERWRR